MGLRIGEPMESFVGKKGTSRVLPTRRRPSTAPSSGSLPVSLGRGSYVQERVLQRASG